MLFFFFFQAEDGIRDKLVTGVQTCALPILVGIGEVWRHLPLIPAGFPSSFARRIGQPILRAPLRPSGRPATSDARRRSSWWKKPTLRVKFLGSDMCIFLDLDEALVMPVTPAFGKPTAMSYCS